MPKEPPRDRDREPRDDDTDESGGEEDRSARKRIDQLLPDVVKRAVYAGLGAVFSTEEGIRRIASDFHLPKDVANFLIQQASSSKDEVLRIVAQELGKFLSTVNISGELQKLLTSVSFEIKTEIRFIPNDEAVGGVKPDIKRQVQVKRTDKKEETSNGKDEK